MRRVYGKGFVYKTDKSKHWTMAIPWTDEDGQRHRLTKTSSVPCFPDKVMKSGEVRSDNRGKTTAEQALSLWRDELVRTAGECVGSAAPLYEYARDYIGEKSRLQSIADVTAHGYEAILKLIMGTELANTPLRDVTPDMIRDVEATLLQDGLSTNTVNKAHVLLKSVCREAVRRDDLAKNPFELVDAPRRKPKPINSLTADSVKELNAKLSDLGSNPIAMAARIALMTGMRQGEISALRWVDVDLKRKTLRVEHALTRVGGGRYKLAAPKTPKSRRTIPIGDSLASFLRDRKAAMMFDVADMELGWDNRLYVLGTPDGKWMNPAYLGHQWTSFARFNDIRGTQGELVRFHDLRHTFATLSITKGVDVKTVSVILGHASAAMTLDIYADALEDSKRTGMSLMDEILSA